MQQKFAFTCSKMVYSRHLTIGNKLSCGGGGERGKVVVHDVWLLTLLNTYGAILFASFISTTCLDSMTNTSPLSILHEEIYT